MEATQKKSGKKGANGSRELATPTKFIVLYRKSETKLQFSTRCRPCAEAAAQARTSLFTRRHDYHATACVCFSIRGVYYLRKSTKQLNFRANNHLHPENV